MIVETEPMIVETGVKLCHHWARVREKNGSEKIWASSTGPITEEVIKLQKYQGHATIPYDLELDDHISQIVWICKSDHEQPYPRLKQLLEERHPEAAKHITIERDQIGWRGCPALVIHTNLDGRKTRLSRKVTSKLPLAQELDAHVRYLMGKHSVAPEVYMTARPHTLHAIAKMDQLGWDLINYYFQNERTTPNRNTLGKIHFLGTIIKQAVFWRDEGTNALSSEITYENGLIIADDGAQAEIRIHDNLASIASAMKGRKLSDFVDAPFSHAYTVTYVGEKAGHMAMRAKAVFESWENACDPRPNPSEEQIVEHAKAILTQWDRVDNVSIEFLRTLPRHQVISIIERMQIEKARKIKTKHMARLGLESYGYPDTIIEEQTSGRYMISSNSWGTIGITDLIT